MSPLSDPDGKPGRTIWDSLPRLLAVGVGLGWAGAMGGLLGLAAGYEFAYTRAREDADQSWRDGAKAIPVVVASRDLYPGMPIVPDDVDVRLFIVANVDTEHTFDDRDAVLGQIVHSPILAQEPIRLERLQ